MAAQLFEIYKLSEGDVRRHSIRFADVLDDDELLTGTPTATEATGDIVIGNRQVNTEPILVRGKPAKVGQAVQFTTAGQQVAVATYTITGSVQTTKGQTIGWQLVLLVQ